jgi:hypothetical protein
MACDPLVYTASQERGPRPCHGNLWRWGLAARSACLALRVAASIEKQPPMAFPWIRGRKV